MTRWVRYCGGPRDGQYQEWDNDRGWPPPEICTIASMPVSLLDYFGVDPTQAMALPYTQTRYQRVGAQDITGAELYATGEVITACRQGIPLSTLGIAPIDMMPRHEDVRLIGGPHDNKRITVPYPPLPAIRVSADMDRQWTPDTDIFPSEPDILYYRMAQRDAAGVLLYVWSDYVDDLTAGVVPWDVVHDADVMAALAQQATRLRDARLLLEDLILGEGVLLRPDQEPLEDRFTYTMAYATDAEMSGKREYPLDAVARENERRNAAIQKAQDCIDSIGEVTDVQ